MARSTVRRLLPVLLWLLLMLVAAGLASRTRVVADLSAFLPAAPTAEQRVLIEQLRSGATARLLLIGVRSDAPPAGTSTSTSTTTMPAEDPEAAALRTRVSRALGEALRRGGEFEAVHNGDTTAWQDSGPWFLAHRYLLSPAVTPERFTVEGLRAGIDDTLSLLGTPAGAMIKPLLWRDPTGEVAQMARSMLPAGAPRSEGGVWVSRQLPRAVLVATTRADGADLDGQARAQAGVRAAFEAVLAREPAARAAGLRLELSGPGVMAVQSRALIEAEVEWLARVGTVLMVLLLLLSFASLRALSVALLPVASGVLAGFVVVGLVFGQVHGFTLGFGTTLIGEAVDYAIYYLIQARGVQGAPGAGARHWLAHSWPTVRLGLWTSLAGFAALALSGFPGLAQLGVFSAAGLLAAAATTRWVLVRLAPDGATGQGLRPLMGRWMRAALHQLPRWRLPLWLLSAVALAGLCLAPSAWRGNLASMSPVSAAAMALDASLRADLGAADGGVLVAVEGPDEATVLERAEAAGARLDGLVDQGLLPGYDSPARWLPSPALQRQRQAGLPTAEVLRARLQQATEGGPLPAARLEAFITDVQAQRGAALITSASLAGTPLASAVQAQLTPGRAAADGQPARAWTALIHLHLPEAGAGRADPVPALRSALAGLPETRLVRIQPELDGLYGHYLHEALWQALAGAGLVVALLALHLRDGRRLLRVCAPLAASVVLVHAGLALAGVALGVLHLVGFLLVVAVGSNYALFFDQLRQQAGVEPDLEMLASLLIANLTLVLSFALLAGASMPALAAIGQVVAPGAALSLWLAAAFMAPRTAGRA
ncbi:putative exporter [Sphaerotilus hippei]|uniref:Putative exporter n=1 Tax=Sphaerotilus hippei TaxID=744406 RepID=A0A318H172_9BURK|nr:MMPL family transporter [Sphaerotilus hippei]PXW96634.1 putative exporter [Sphaerotilus hippei]